MAYAVFQKFLSRNMRNNFAEMIAEKQVITYIDDVIL